MTLDGWVVVNVNCGDSVEMLWERQHRFVVVGSDYPEGTERNPSCTDDPQAGRLFKQQKSARVLLGCPVANAAVLWKQ